MFPVKPLPSRGRSGKQGHWPINLTLWSLWFHATKMQHFCMQQLILDSSSGILKHSRRLKISMQAWSISVHPHINRVPRQLICLLESHHKCVWLWALTNPCWLGFDGSQKSSHNQHSHSQEATPHVQQEVLVRGPQIAFHSAKTDHSKPEDHNTWDPPNTKMKFQAR